MLYQVFADLDRETDYLPYDKLLPHQCERWERLAETFLLRVDVDSAPDNAA